MRFIRACTILLVGLASSVARACTVCGSNTGQQLRAGIFDGHFWRSLTLLSLPFPVFALVVAAIYFGMPDIEERQDPAEDIVRPASVLQNGSGRPVEKM